MTSHASFDYNTFPYLVRALLPFGGDIALIVHAYIDESGTHDDANVMAMAGYVLSAEQADKFSRDWGRHLKDSGIPFAHMTDLANGNLHYKNMSKEMRIEQGKALISIIKKRTRFGFAVAIDKVFYDSQLGQITGLPTAYTYCVMSCLMQIKQWMDKNNKTSRMAYMFESGHQNAGEACRLLHNISQNQNAKNLYRYSSHSFMEKADALPLQAADMLAWQVHHFHEGASNGTIRSRKDFEALVRPIDKCQLHTSQHLLSFKDRVTKAGLLSIQPSFCVKVTA